MSKQVKSKKASRSPIPRSVFKTVFYLSILLLGLLALFSYYYNRFTGLVDCSIIGLMVLLAIDSWIYSTKKIKFRWQYRALGTLFILVALTHLSRLIFGPLQCAWLSHPLSVYLYEDLALLTGIALVLTASYLYVRGSGVLRHQRAGIIVGCAMIINHTIKLIVGRCI